MTKPHPKIHFAALLGVAVDADLFPYWIAHYKAFGFDSYTVFLHESPDDERNAFARAIFIYHGFVVSTVPESAIRNNPVCPGDPGIGVRSVLFDMMNVAMPKGDFFITADGDEIQEWIEHPRALIERGVQVVLGVHLDCFDETLHAPDPKKSLDENYPLREYSLPSRWKTSPYNTKKICMAPAGYPVDFSGSHEVKRHHQDVTPSVRASGILDVLHYRWRDTLFHRVKDRPNWPPDEIAAIKQFFSVDA